MVSATSSTLLLRQCRHCETPMSTTAPRTGPTAVSCPQGLSPCLAPHTLSSGVVPSLCWQLVPLKGKQLVLFSL